MTTLLTSAPTPSAPRAAGRATAVLALLCGMQFLLVLDVTVVNVAMPALRSALGLSAVDAQWALTAYAVPFGALLLLGGRAGDRFGRRRVLLGGLLVFAAGCLAAAGAGSATALLAGRVLQGIGAAAVSPSALALLVTTFPSGPEHRRAFAAWGGVGASGAAAGVLLGGVLTSAVGWRSVFLVGAPAALLLAGGAARLLPDVRPAEPRRLDAPGALLGALAAATALLGCARPAEMLWWHGAATVAIVGLWLRIRRTDDPLVAPALLARRSVHAGTTLMLLAAGSLVTAFYLCSLRLQEGYGHSAVRTGCEFLPAAVLTALSARRAAVAVARLGARTVGGAGFLVAAAGATAMALAPQSGPAWLSVLPGFLALAGGLGACFVVAGMTTMSHIGPGEAGTLAGLSTTAHELGIGFVLALVVALGSADGGILRADDLTAAYGVLALTLLLGAATSALAPGRGAATGPSFGH